MHKININEVVQHQGRMFTQHHYHLHNFCAATFTTTLYPLLVSSRIILEITQHFSVSISLSICHFWLYSVHSLHDDAAWSNFPLASTFLLHFKWHVSLALVSLLHDYLQSFRLWFPLLVSILFLPFISASLLQLNISVLKSL